MTLRALISPAAWRERTADREQLRRRALALTGLSFLLGGLLTALGFGVVVVVAFGLVVLVLLSAAALWALHRFRVRRRLGAAVVSIARAARALEARLERVGLGQRLRRLAVRLRESAGTGLRRARVLLALGGRRSAACVAQVLRTGGRVRSRLSIFEPTRVDRRGNALRLNMLGAELRRAGEYERAAEHHRAALAIVRDLGDRRAEALTLNNLALAVARADGVAAAVQYFDQAVVILRELGDEEREGQVIANLGFVHRRNGRTAEAVGLLRAALHKLPPESSAYHRVEEELRPAS